jgi:flagellar hook-associated protein 1 FlgK
MTISGALSNALSGLRAAGRGAEVVSSNISNALTPGYARRELSLVSSSIGDFGGVRINGIQRISDAGLASDKRLAEAELRSTGAAVAFFATAERLIGTPDNPASLSAQLSSFESSLITASSRPDAPERLTTAVAGARDLVRSITQASQGIQDTRSAADRSIAAQVSELNNALQAVRALNSQITATQSQGGENATLLDQRQQIVGEISAIVPIKQIPRDNGQIALYSTGGSILLDGTAATIDFTRSNTVTPYQTIETNTLSGLTLNGTALRTDSDRGQLRGGSLGAQFAVRDEYAVDAQSQLDALARDLVERFQDPAIDPSLAPGDAGLFTDRGSMFDPLDEIGLSTRLRLNSAVDPQQGGEAWRMRDGINATTPGNVGDASILQNLSNVISESRIPASGNFGSGAFSASSLLTTFASEIGTQRTSAEQRQSYASARFTELVERQLADGVDTDAEIQRLLLIERTYAANARMVQTVDELLDTLTRI